MRCLMTGAIAMLMTSAFAYLPADFDKRVSISLSESARAKVTALGDVSAVTDLPVLVRLSSAVDSEFYSLAGENGIHLVFGTEQDGEIVVYPHEIDTWNPDGVSLVWVKLPALSADSEFNLYYGGTGTGGLASSTWSNYAGVWHLNESGTDGGTVNPIIVSNRTANGSQIDGEAYGGTSATNGVIGGGRTISTSATTSNAIGGIFVPGDKDCTLFNGAFTISGWIVHKNQAYNYDHIFFRKSAAKDTNGFCAEMANAASSVNVYGSSTTMFSAGLPSGLKGTDWTHLVMVYTNTTCSVYTNGVLSASGTVAKVTDNGQMFAFGNDVDGYAGAVGDISWKGAMDELRLSGVSFSAQYVAAEYVAMSDANLLSFSAPVLMDADAFRFEGAPTATVSTAGVSLSVDVLKGKGSLLAVFTDLATGAAITNSLASEANVTGVTTFDCVQELAADKMWSCKVVGVTAAETVSAVEGPNFFTGAPTVAKVADADEFSMSSGSFVIARGLATEGDLLVTYQLSGGDGTYEQVMGVVTISNGQSTATVQIKPVYNPDITEDAVVTLALTPGGYLLGDSASAAMTVVNTSVNTREMYVAPAPAGSDANDGLTSVSPKLTISNALAALVAAGHSAEATTIFLMDGEHVVSAEVLMEIPVTIRSLGGDRTKVTVVENQSAGCRVFRLNDAQAKLADVTVSGGGGGDHRNGISGGNVYIDSNGGTVENCVLVNGSAAPKHNMGGGNLYMMAGLVLGCELRNGAAQGNQGGGNVLMTGGRLESCLLAGGNGNGTYGGGLRINGGSAVNCTIFGNTGTSSSGVFVGKTGNSYTAQVVNCVIVDNDYTALDWDYANACGPIEASACFVNCMTDGTSQPNETCFGSPFGFLNRSASDYHLTAASAARNAGATVDGLGAHDFEGHARVQGGSVDVGCYELDESVPIIGFDAATPKGLQPLDVTFSVVAGGVSDPVYVWNFGDGSDPVESSESTIAHNYAACGYFDVSVAIKGTETSLIIPRYVEVHPKDLYVDLASTGAAYPFVSAESATRSLAEAVAESYDGSTIWIKDGIYPNSAVVSVTKAITIRSLSGDPGGVMISNTASRTRLFNINNPEAWVRDVTLAKGVCYQSRGGNVFINSLGGNVSNCTIVAGIAENYVAKGGNVAIASANGLVTHCRILNGEIKSSGSEDCGGNVYMSAGQLEHSLVAGGRDVTSQASANYAAGVEILGGTMRNCTIAGNAGRYVGGVYAMVPAVVEDCIIAGNTVSVTSGDLAAWTGDAAAFVNCLSDTASPINETCEADLTAKIINNLEMNDYTHAPGSKGVDAGLSSAEYEGIPQLDLAGSARLQGAAMDLGCYEAEAGVFSVGFDSDVKTGILSPSVTVTFTVIPDGHQEGDVLTFDWDFDNNGTVDATTHELSSSWTYTVGGTYAVSLAAVNETSGKSANTVVKPGLLQFAPKTLYVWRDSTSAETPFATWETASSNITEAIAAAVDGCEIVIRKGSYAEGRVVVEKALNIHSETELPEDVVISRGSDGRILLVNATSAIVHGLVIHDGYGNTSPAGVIFGVLGGTVSNCVIRNCRATNYTADGAAVDCNSAFGLVSHCVITNNVLGSDNGGGFKAVVNMKKGRLSNSLVKDNCRDTDGTCTGLLKVGSSAVVENCTFIGNSTDNRQCVDVEDGGRIVNSVFADNVFTSDESRGFAYGTGVPAAFVNCATDLAVPLNGSCSTGPVSVLFANYAQGVFLPMKGGPLYNAGVDYDGMASVDLSGQPRKRGKRIEIGCFECFIPGFSLIIK
jgi:hypothetical protein